MKVSVIVPSAGCSTRMGPGIYKPFLILKSKPLIVWTLQTLCESDFVDEIILVVRKESLDKARRLVRRSGFSKVCNIVPGGRTRCDSVLNGLQMLEPDTDIVLIHDGARPFLNAEMIKQTVSSAKKFGASAVGVPIKPTVKEIDKNGFVQATLKRDKIWEIQTPQGFKKEIITKAYKGLNHHKKDATDDAYLVEQMGKRIRLVKGSYENIKITTPEDLKMAEAILDAHRHRIRLS